MRIAFDYQIFCQQSYGGISRYFVRLVEQFVARIQDVGIFRAAASQPLCQDVARWCGAWVRLESLSVYKWADVARTQSDILSKRGIQNWRPQVVHETYYSRWASAARSCPTVVTAYDMIHELFKDHFPARDKTTTLKRKAIDRADHVICISECTRQDVMILFGISGEKLSVVHLGAEQFSNDLTPFKKKTTSGKPYLLYVGSRERYKNFSMFLRAVASSRRLKADFDILAFGSGRFSPVELTLFYPNWVSSLIKPDN